MAASWQTAFTFDIQRKIVITPKIPMNLLWDGCKGWFHWFYVTVFTNRWLPLTQKIADSNLLKNTQWSKQRICKSLWRISLNFLKDHNFSFLILPFYIDCTTFNNPDFNRTWSNLNWTQSNAKYQSNQLNISSNLEVWLRLDCIRQLNFNQSIRLRSIWFDRGSGSIARSSGNRKHLSFDCVW